VTIQTVSSAADLAMLLTAAAVVGLAVGAVVQLARGRARSAAGLAGALGALIVVYGAVLLAAGLSSREAALRPGDAKCFDDWCAAMVGARQDAAVGTVLVDVQLQNRGRGRAMKADLARAYLEVPGGVQVMPADGHRMQTMLQPGERVDVQLTFAAPGPALRGARFVVAEGAGDFGPGTFEIGGEGSPFHARAGWPLP
jgi:hypothetical protein